MGVPSTPIAGVAAGAPFLAVPPPGGPSASKPIVVAWHLIDSPRTEAAFAAAIPLRGLDAWRIYLGLPMFGSRTPPGGVEELMRLGHEDAVMNLNGPVGTQAAEEFEPAWADLRSQLDLGDGPIGVLGGSMGAAVALLVLAESRLDISAAVLVSPLVRLRSTVDALGRRFGVTYPWPESSLEVARRLDFVARADDIARRGDLAVLLVVGADDDRDGFREPAAELRSALAGRYADPRRCELVLVPAMAHALADEPGVEPAPQSPAAVEVDRHASRWLRRHLRP